MRVMNYVSPSREGLLWPNLPFRHMFQCSPGLAGRAQLWHSEGPYEFIMILFSRDYAESFTSGVNHALARTEMVCMWKVPPTFDFRVRVALIIHVISSWHRKTCSSLWRDLDGQIQINIHLSVSWSTTDLIDLMVSLTRFPSAVFAQGRARTKE